MMWNNSFGELHLEGLVGRNVSLHNGEDWGPFEYNCVGYALSLNQNQEPVILIYLLKNNGNGLPIVRRMVDIKFATAEETEEKVDE